MIIVLQNIYKKMISGNDFFLDGILITDLLIIATTKKIKELSIAMIARPTSFFMREEVTKQCYLFLIMPNFFSMST